MNKENIKRERQENWTQTEKELLRELVRRHINVINDKRNDVKMISKKKSAWIDVDINMKAAGFKRTVPKLKEQWHRMKVAARKSNTEMQKSLRATGNVVEVKEPPEEDLAVQDMIREDFMEDSILIDSNTDAYEVEFLQEAMPSFQNDYLEVKDCHFDPVVEENSIDDCKTPIQKLKHLKKKNDPKPVDILQQRCKQIVCQSSQEQELHDLKLEQLKNKIKYEKKLFEKELEIKNIILEREKLTLENARK